MRIIKNIFTAFLLYLDLNLSLDKWWEIRSKALQSGKGGKGLNISKRRYYLFTNKKGAYIPLETTFIDRPTFPHGISGIYTSMGAKIGKGCVIFQQVTIGSNTLTDSEKTGSPTIGDNVYIGAGAKIIGNVKIGSNVRIGANAVVVEDVEDNCTVVLQKPRIIKKASLHHNEYFTYEELQKQSQ